MKKLNEIIERISFAYHSQDELARAMIDCIVLVILALGISFAFWVGLYFLMG